ncbi:MAG: hypothetical protein GIKADHBN_00396 [Phycisphaerales bacterium]|nr:hypothetical protein [Phycisphaerales bacterium]
MKKLTIIALVSSAGLVTGCETNRTARSTTDRQMTRSTDRIAATPMPPMSFDPSFEPLNQQYSVTQTSNTGTRQVGPDGRTTRSSDPDAATRDRNRDTRWRDNDNTRNTRPDRNTDSDTRWRDDNRDTQWRNENADTRKMTDDRWRDQNAAADDMNQDSRWRGHDPNDNYTEEDFYAEHDPNDIAYYGPDGRRTDGSGHDATTTARRDRRGDDAAESRTASRNERDDSTYYRQDDHRANEGDTTGPSNVAANNRNDRSRDSRNDRDSRMSRTDAGSRTANDVTNYRQDDHRANERSEDSVASTRDASGRRIDRDSDRLSRADRVDRGDPNYRQDDHRPNEAAPAGAERSAQTPGQPSDDNVNYRKDDHRANEGLDADRNRPNLAMAMNATPEQRILSVLSVKNREEIQFGQLAEQRGSSDAVKEYGRQLIDEHKKAEDKVQTVARNAGITLIPAMDTEQMLRREKRGEPVPREAPPRRPIDEFRTLEGSDFDLKFARHMQKAHRDLINRVESAQTQVKDDRVRRLLNELLPGLRHHEQEAADLVRELEGGDRSDRNTDPDDK